MALIKAFGEPRLDRELASILSKRDTPAAPARKVSRRGQKRAIAGAALLICAALAIAQWLSGSKAVVTDIPAAPSAVVAPPVATLPSPIPEVAAEPAPASAVAVPVAAKAAPAPRRLAAPRPAPRTVMVDAKEEPADTAEAIENPERRAQEHVDFTGDVPYRGVTIFPDGERRISRKAEADTEMAQPVEAAPFP